MEPFDHGYLVTTRVLHSNDGLQSNTSQYILNGKLNNIIATINPVEISVRNHEPFICGCDMWDCSGKSSRFYFVIS
jgi:hypothetical protein